MRERRLELIASIKDVATRQLVEIACAEVRCFASGDCLPESDFDLLFFTECMHDFLSRDTMLRRILAGEDLAAEHEI